MSLLEDPSFESASAAWRPLNQAGSVTYGWGGMGNPQSGSQVLYFHTSIAGGSIAQDFGAFTGQSKSVTALGAIPLIA